MGRHQVSKGVLKQDMILGSMTRMLPAVLQLG